MSQTYDGATTALRRRAKRWKALAKRLRESALYASRLQRKTHRELELAIEHNKGLRERETSDGAMVLTLQLRDARRQIAELEDAAVWADKRYAEVSDLEKAAAQGLAATTATLMLAERDLSDAHRRIEELTAELESKTRESFSWESEYRGLEDLCKLGDDKLEAAEAEVARLRLLLQGHEALEPQVKYLRAELATERAAREQERQLKENTLGNCMMLLGERDTALARVKELEEVNSRVIADCRKYEHDYAAAETALASARGLLEKTPMPDPDGEGPTNAQVELWAQFVHDMADLLYGSGLASHPSPAPVAAPCAGCAAWREAYDPSPFGPQTPDEVSVFLRERDHVNGQCAALKIAQVQKDYDACHRQHEQCMKLLELCEQQRLPLDIGELVREMLAKGELPEGSL